MNDLNSDAAKSGNEASGRYSHVVPHNTGFSLELPKGGRLSVSASSIVDFVVLNKHDVKDAFDQATTIGVANSVFIGVGDSLYSKNLVKLMTIVSDDYEGNHDLQLGPCSSKAYDYMFEVFGGAEDGSSNAFAVKSRDDLPPHGCKDNLKKALSPYEVEERDIPAAFNLFQCYEVRPDGELVRHVEEHRIDNKRSRVEFEANHDVIVAMSACPEIRSTGQEVHLEWTDAI